ncbi:ABC transporter ATP-binding protein [Thalassospira sp. MA62]|nr:ABC transporter ATP-binding protein [Thalassospira sp. MA62]
MIEISNLNAWFDDNHVLKDVDINVPANGSFGLVGESGSGKSTVLRTITGLVDDWEGEIRVNNKALGPKRDKAFYRLVQMVFQDPFGSLHPRHTIDRILTEPVNIHGLGNSDSRVVEALKQVGLDNSFRFRYPHQLSGGQRQRVAIARALILEPKILLLDEPTSALDVSIQAEVLNLLSRLRRELGLTYVMVSHDLAVVAHMCDDIAIMNHGRIVERATAAQLADGTLEHPYSQQLYKAAGGYDRTIIDGFVDWD